MQPVQVEIGDIAAEQLSCAAASSASLATFMRYPSVRGRADRDGYGRGGSRLLDRCARSRRGAGAASLLALLQEPDRVAGRLIGVVITGGNIDLSLFRQWLLDSGP